jgi:hypothetical protein
MPSSSVDQGQEVNVICVLKKNAKSAKKALEAANLLNKNFRMVPSVSWHNCIALPVHEDALAASMNGPWTEWTEHTEVQVCPYSTSVMGNYHQKPTEKAIDGLTPGQQAIYQTIRTMSKQETIAKECLNRIQQLNNTICPKKIETFGDDRTLVIPPNAFVGEEFDSLLQIDTKEMNIDDCRIEFWKQLAESNNSKRIARRGAIDPNSKIRESGHRLVWPLSGIPERTGMCQRLDMYLIYFWRSTSNAILLLGPGSPGWIQVTEQGIKQSFDMCRVMFSRGNISEKIRFGKLVCPGEKLLDLYAGIGYYTLPAVIHGGASHVYACEWNKHAANALKYNIQDNHVQDKVTVLVGDSRVSAKEHNLINMFDRVSLGLLPSSEGGWRTAIRAIKDVGGWLHIHANVPVKEVDSWTLWTCSRLLECADEEERPKDWIVLCHHVEKVKSFAPTVAHYVADIYVGLPWGLIECENMNGFKAGALRNGTVVPCMSDSEPPSCALSPDGALSQEWMR